MFGINSPQRLLQSWSSLKQFSEELYAMCKSRAPVEREGPVTIRVKPGQTALRLTSRPADDPEPTPSRVQSRRVGLESTSSTPRPRPLSSAGRAEQFTSSYSATGGYGPPSGPIQPPPLLEIDGGVSFSGSTPARFGVPPEVLDPLTRQYVQMKMGNPVSTDPSIPIEVDPPVQIGQVVSGSGDTYQVTLYPEGKGGDAGDTVQVTIPMIDSGETIPPSTWLVPVIRTGDTFTAQPPVWLDSEGD